MHTEKHHDTAGTIKAVTYLSVIANISLCVIKLIVGILIASLSLIADGIHSLSDLVTDAAVLLGIHFGSKKPDKSHPYGHGRIETFSAGLVAIILMMVGGLMIYYASLSLARDEITCPHFTMAIAAGLSIAIKEWLYRITKKVAVKSHSSALYANAWHHRSDALSSIAVVIGFIAMKFGFTHGDQVAAITVGLMILWVGVKIIADTLRELTEAAIDPETIDEMKKIIDADASIRNWHQLRTRTLGREVFLDLHILVDPELNIAAAHEIAEHLENTLQEQIPRPMNIVVHIEPDVPELRK